MTIKELKIQLALGILPYEDKIALAKNPNTPKEILTILSTDKDKIVRCWVAENLNTPKEVLTKLSTDKSWYVRCRVVDNPNTPKRILTKLLEDEHWMVKHYTLQKLTEQDKPNEQTS